MGSGQGTSKSGENAEYCRHTPVRSVAPAYDDNILHFPPIYSFLGRIPFLIIDSLLNGHVPGIFERQHPSLIAVYGLVRLQHIALWIALRYFLLAFPARAVARGAIAILLASMASFYTFAHTCGSEAMTPITYFLVFGAGIRALLNRANWVSWVTYTAALFLAVRSRHINLILAAWLPGTPVLFAICPSLPFPPTRLNPPAHFRRSRSFPTLTALTAFLCSLAGLCAAKIVVHTLCHQFGVVERSS